MARRREIRDVNPTSIGLQEDVSLDQVGIFDHLTPSLQSLLADAKKFKESCNYAFCWAKNSIVWLRKSEGSRPIAIKSSRDLDNLMSREQSSSDTDAYKTYRRNKVLMLTRISKKMYFHKYFEDNLKNTKKVWEGINSLLGRKNNAHKVITSLKCPQTKQVSYNTSEFPDIMNKFFSSVGHSLASKMPYPIKQFSEYLPQVNSPGSFFFNSVSSSEIELEIVTIPQNKAHGLYSFPTHILRSAKHIISQPLSVLLNKSLEYGIYPTKLKLAKVIPIYKNDDPSDPSNYRPISLLSVFNRMLSYLIALNHSSTKRIYSMIHNMVSVKSVPLSMLS